MIYQAKLQTSVDRSDVIQHILKKRGEGPYTVIDVGGSMGGWSFPYVDALVDFQTPVDVPSRITYFQCDITHPDQWGAIMAHVEKHGKFDFSICTHTLEDIMNPGFVCEQLSKISKEGYIAVPSKYIELTRCEGPYRGYIHHRWIFVVRNQKFIGYPKLNLIEYLDVDSKIKGKNYYGDMSFFWKDEVSVNYLNNNFMGPDVGSVVKYFNTLLDKDDYDGK